MAREYAPGKTRIGWIGTGVMGSSMCGHLIAAGYAATVFNRTAEKARPLVEKGAQLADSPRAVAEASDVVFSMVGYPRVPKILKSSGRVHLSENLAAQYALMAKPSSSLALGTR